MHQRLVGTPSSTLTLFNPPAIYKPQNISFDKMNTNLIKQNVKPCLATGPENTTT